MSGYDLLDARLLRWRLAHGVLADEIERLTAQRDQWCAEATARARRDGMKRAYIDSIMADLQKLAVERADMQAEVERLRAQVALAEHERDKAKRECESMRRTRDGARDALDKAEARGERLKAELHDAKAGRGVAEDATAAAWGAATMPSKTREQMLAERARDRLLSDAAGVVASANECRLDFDEETSLTWAINVLNRSVGEVGAGWPAGDLDHEREIAALLKQGTEAVAQAGPPREPKLTRCEHRCRHGQRCIKRVGHDKLHDWFGCACANPDAWCGRCETPLGRRPAEGEAKVTCSGCGAVITLTPAHDPMGEG